MERIRVKIHLSKDVRFDLTSWKTTIRMWRFNYSIIDLMQRSNYQEKQRGRNTSLKHFLGNATSEVASQTDLSLRVASTENDNSENVVFKTQFRSFFILWKSQVPFLGYSIFYILKHSINFETCYIMMNLSVRIFGILNHLVMTLGKHDIQEHYFSEIFCMN